MNISQEDELRILLEEIGELSYLRGAFFSINVIDNPDNLETEDCMLIYFKSKALANILGSRRFEGLQIDLNNFKTDKTENWVELLQEQLNEWTSFTVHYSPKQIDTHLLETKKKAFAEDLSKFLLENELVETRLVREGFHTYNAPWGDQMGRDILFKINNKIIVLHFGWSS